MSSPPAVLLRQRLAPAEDPEPIAQSEAKRRKVRKGTYSCWECKRQKMKCVLDALTNAACNGCLRRGSKCISQEFPEEAKAMASYGARTLTIPGEDSMRTGQGILTPAFMNSDSNPSRFLLFYKSSEALALASEGKHEKLSRTLHKLLPSREDIERICSAIRHPSVLTHEILTMPYDILDQEGLEPADSLLEIPKPNAHPVLIARHMLKLAVFLQHLHPDLQENIQGLSESPRAMLKQLADLAISLVTTNDELLGSIEGLECIMIEGMYQANIGNLRRSWVSGRRAMGIAQLMGLDRKDNRAQYKVLNPDTKYHPQLMWLLDRSMASDAMLANDTPMGRLERLHCIISSRILERNKLNPSSHALALTRTLDAELQRAARSLPSKWWLAPNLDITSTESQGLFWNTRRLYAQVLHYNLVNQLHLPYMLRSSPSSAERKYEYSRMACVNASREVLSRFITLRSFNRTAYSCRSVDFLALMAAITLLLAHLDSHRLLEAENLLAHQYLGDRAMIEQAQDNMKELNRINSDALSAQSADLLRRLLNIEVETADGYSSCEKVSVQETGLETPPPDQDDDAIVSVHIPYFGIIKIAREGTPIAGSYGPVNTPSISQGIPTSNAKSQTHLGDLQLPSNGTNEMAIQIAPSDPLLQQGEYPGLTAGGEDWAFQGVDMAFFDSLMSSAGDEGNEDEGNEDADWATWQRLT
ncbi:uncharacterized protein BCR38DRAFT_466020 [Pseudomassariella vexata]|uniref:Zn(2)-C6 fungal-type domain-containing protein n=1 Tax=Pseudomassariella vexata TaxID=1141098 RepID=A0A1Y2DXE1_9PEZI|nr:uncharacterized protein BCR38DRAFT_466020 [Pseudomassariella vexata]ORY63941.1 hypothetical protein BCR38DRAFT_466020 [Pseudomassariella vexata]